MNILTSGFSLGFHGIFTEFSRYSHGLFTEFSRAIDGIQCSRGSHGVRSG